MRAALYQPDQPGNVGAIVRLGACLGVPIDIIEPCGFAFSDRALKRAVMDYAAFADVTRHASWESFERQVSGRILLLTTKGAAPLFEARFEHDDILLLGSESEGAPDTVHARADLRLRIPQVRGTRSLNIAVAAGIALAEALRQMEKWPENDRA
jgi:tRNA (cytidine/uridine-2'-O-)-methyltransferase